MCGQSISCHVCLCFAGLSPRYPLYQRIAIMQVVRHLLADPLVTYHLFSTFDMCAERRLDAVQVKAQAGMGWVGA